MVDISLIVLIIFVISTLLGVYKLIKLGVTIAGFISVVISAALLLMGVALYLDVNTFQEKFETAPKLFLLKEGDTLLAGFSGVLGKAGEKPALLSAEALVDLQAKYDANDLASILDGNYKLFIINITVFNNITEDLLVEDETYTKGEIVVMMHSSTPMDDFTEDLLQRKDISAQQHDAVKRQLVAKLQKDSPDDTAFKGNLFMLLLAQAVKEQGSRFILTEFQHGHIRIYPETALFKLVKYTPPRYLSQILRESTAAANMTAPQA